LSKYSFKSCRPSVTGGGGAGGGDPARLASFELIPILELLLDLLKILESEAKDDCFFTPLGRSLDPLGVEARLPLPLW
jgi:hypothetical protein